MNIERGVLFLTQTFVGLGEEEEQNASSLCSPLFSKFNENAFEDLVRLEDDVAKIQVSIDYLKTTAERRVRKDGTDLNCKYLGEPEGSSSCYKGLELFDFES